MNKKQLDVKVIPEVRRDIYRKRVMEGEEERTYHDVRIRAQNLATIRKTLSLLEYMTTGKWNDACRFLNILLTVKKTIVG